MKAQVVSQADLLRLGEMLFDVRTELRVAILGLRCRDGRPGGLTEAAITALHNLLEEIRLIEDEP